MSPQARDTPGDASDPGAPSQVPGGDVFDPGMPTDVPPAMPPMPADPQPGGNDETPGGAM